MTRKGTLTLECSTTPVAGDYREFATITARCLPMTAVFDAGRYDRSAVAKARDAWHARMISEHRSAAVFAGLFPQLVEANATLDMQGAVLRMAQDELRHAEVSAHVVVALGGEARAENVDFDLKPPAQHRGCSPEERALRNVIYGSCLTELINAARFVDTIDQTDDAFVREATRQLLADEAVHAQFGFHYLESWRSWLEAHPEVCASLGVYLRHAFATFERDYSGAGQPAHALLRDERALGLPDPARTPVVFYQTVEGAVVPGLERFGIGAAQAWSQRAFR